MMNLITNLFFWSGIALSAEQHHTHALPLLTWVNHRGIDGSEWLHFWRAVALHQTMHYELSLKEVDAAESSFNELPMRYQALLHVLKDDIKQWEEGLEDIHRRMRRVARQLKNVEDIPDARRQQADIIKELDKLIDEKQKKADAQKQAATANPNGKPGMNPAQPQEDSAPGNDNGPGNVLEQKLKHYGEIWGQLSEKERARAIQELTKDLPPRFRQQIEDYFKVINKGVAP